MKLRWPEDIRRRWGIIYTSIIAIDIHDHLWTSRCSRTKQVEYGVPEQLYQSTILKEFYDYAISNNVRYGIVSDRYGLHMDDEILPYYDIHPSTLSKSKKRDLGVIVGKKTRAAGYNSLVFFAHSPLMSAPYFEILSSSGLTVFFVTTLRTDR